MKRGYLMATIQERVIAASMKHPGTMQGCEALGERDAKPLMKPDEWVDTPERFDEITLMVIGSDRAMIRRWKNRFMA